MHFELQPALCGPTISLRPLVADDLEALYAVASDPVLWAQHPEPTRWQRPVFERLFADSLASGGALVVTENRSGELIGSSRYYEWAPGERSVAIGYSFLARNHWGRGTNREVKQLMLSHAFRWAKVVWFHVGTENWRSRRAMEKIGGILDHGTRRTHNGVVHECVVYRIDADAHVRLSATDGVVDRTRTC